RCVAPPPVPPAIVAAYQERMLALWHLAGRIDNHDKPAAVWIRFSLAADAALRDFEQWLEPQLGEGGEVGSPCRLGQQARWRHRADCGDSTYHGHDWRG